MIDPEPERADLSFACKQRPKARYSEIADSTSQPVLSSAPKRAALRYWDLLSVHHLI